MGPLTTSPELHCALNGRPDDDRRDFAAARGAYDAAVMINKRGIALARSGFTDIRTRATSPFACAYALGYEAVLIAHKEP